MKMNLKGQFAEYGIGTELLNLLMDDLQQSGFETIRYEIPPARYAFQIYQNLGFSVESRDEETVSFIWRRQKYYFFQKLLDLPLYGRLIF